MVAVGDATCRALRSCFEDGDRRTNIDARSLRETCPLQTAAEHQLTIDTDLPRRTRYHPGSYPSTSTGSNMVRMAVGRMHWKEASQSRRIIRRVPSRSTVQSGISISITGMSTDNWQARSSSLSNPPCRGHKATQVTARPPLHSADRDRTQDRPILSARDIITASETIPLHFQASNKMFQHVSASTWISPVTQSIQFPTVPYNAPQ